MEKQQHFQQILLVKWMATYRKMKIHLLSITLQKTQFQMNQGPQHKTIYHKSDRKKWGIDLNF